MFKCSKFKTLLNIRIYDFEFVSDFVLRYSDLSFNLLYGITS
jgi:hypothetical protein